MGELLLTLTLVLFLPVVILTSAGTWAHFSLRRANRVAPGRSCVHGTNTVALEPGRGSDAAPPAAFRLPAGGLGRELAPRAAPAPLAEAKTLRPRATPSSTWPERSSRRQSQLDHELVKTSWLARGIEKAQALAALGYRVRRHRGRGAACPPARYEAGAGRQPAGAGRAQPRRDASLPWKPPSASYLPRPRGGSWPAPRSATEPRRPRRRLVRHNGLRPAEPAPAGGP